jgi:hypothetical protein
LINCRLALRVARPLISAMQDPRRFLPDRYVLERRRPHPSAFPPRCGALASCGLPLKEGEYTELDGAV